MRKHAPLILVLLIAATAIGGGVIQKFATDQVQIGIGAGTDDKELIFDVGDGASNPKIVIDTTNKDFDFNKAVNVVNALFRTGDGTAANQVVEFDIGNGATNPKFRWNDTSGQLEFSNDGTNYKAIGSGAGGGSGINLLADDNFDFETADPPQDWTNTGSGTFVAETGVPLFGDQSGLWDPSAAAETLDSNLRVVVEGLEGNQCIGRIFYKWEAGVAGDITFQVLDSGANILAEGDPDPTTGQAKESFLIFTCPTGDSVRLRLTSTADAAAITIDNAHLGSNIREINVASAELFGTSNYVGQTNCSWQGSSGSYASYAVDSDCGVPVVTGRVSAPDTKLPAIKIPSMPPGKYRFVATGFFVHSSATTTGSCYWKFHDGTSNIDGITTTSATGAVTNSGGPLISSEYLVTTTQTDVQIEIQQARISTDASCDIVNNNNTRDFTISVYRYPLDSEKALLLSESNGWHIDAAMYSTAGGMGLPTTVGSTATYAHPEVSAGFLVLNPGSASAQIGCATGTAPEGLDCNIAAVNESASIAFTPPYAGKFKVCAQFQQAQNHPSSSSGATFSWILAETGLTDATIAQQSAAQNKNQQDATSGSLYTENVNLCGDFKFDSVSKKLIRLMYNYDIVTNNLDAASVGLSDVTPVAGGDQQLAWTVEPITQNVPMPVILDTVVSPGVAGQMVIYSARISISGSIVSVSQEYGDWIDTLTDNAPGDMRINVKAAASVDGLFHCTASADSTASGVRDMKVSNAVANQVRVQTVNEVPALIDNQSFFIICVGRR